MTCTTVAGFPAICLVNRGAINEVLLFDTQRVADGILPPNLPGYDESVTSYSYDPEEAKRLLDQSRYAGNMPRISR